MTLKWCHISVIGHRGQFKLALDGAVLVCRHEAWSESFDSYLPAESLRLWRSARHNFRPLIQSLLLCVCALLSYASVHLFYETFRDSLPSALVETVVNYWGFVAAASAVGTVLIAYVAYGALRALRPRPSLCITHATDEEAGQFEFWYRPGDSRALDELVDRLFALSRGGERGSASYGMGSGYTRRHVRPLRALFTGAMSITFMMLLLAHLLKVVYEAYSGHGLRVEPAFYGIFLLPWAFMLALYGIERIRMRFEPVRFRMGLRHYYREEFEKAERRFLDVLREAPDHVPTLYLLTRLTAHRFDFERAFRFCRQLGRIAPEEAEALQEDIWILKRLRGRMDSRTPPPTVDAAGRGSVE